MYKVRMQCNNRLNPICENFGVPWKFRCQKFKTLKHLDIIIYVTYAKEIPPKY